MDNQTLGKNYPATVSEAVKKMISELPKRDKVQIASMTESDLIGLHFSLGIYIRNTYGLWADNKALMKSCREISGDKNLHVDDASSLIIKELWENLKKNNQIRVVK